MTDHPIPHRAALAPKLHTRLDILLARLPPEDLDGVAEALHDVITSIEAAEQATDGRPWIVALRVAQSAGPRLRRLLTPTAPPTEDRPAPHPDVRVEALWAWLITLAEFYCRVHIIHHGLVLRDPEDTDDDDDTETFDFAGHIGEELVRQAGRAEALMLSAWPTARYRLYRVLYTNYSRLRTYTAQRGWVEETDALDYVMRLARMHGLHHYVWERGPHHNTPPRGRLAALRSDRVLVFGRLLIDRFYWLIAGFGYRPLRAVGVNSVVVLGFAYLFWQFNLLCVYSTGGAHELVQQCQPVSFPQALYFSALAFFLAAMGEIIPHPLAGQALLVLESIWGFLNMSVVIAVILNRQRGG